MFTEAELFFVKNVYNIITNFTLSSLIYIFLGASLKSFIVTLYNLFASQKIAKEIQRSFKIKQIIQRAENIRTLLDVDQIYITQLHNGGQWASKNHFLKLSLFSELSIDDPYGKYRTKVFARQLDKIPINHLSEILDNVSGSKSFDIVSTEDLKRFRFYRHLKIDKVSYMILVKIEYKNTTLGFMFLMFCDGKVPSRDKETMDRLKLLGQEVGSVLV